MLAAEVASVDLQLSREPKRGPSEISDLSIAKHSDSTLSEWKIHPQFPCSMPGWKQAAIAFVALVMNVMHGRSGALHAWAAVKPVPNMAAGVSSVLALQWDDPGQGRGIVHMNHPSRDLRIRRSSTGVLSGIRPHPQGPSKGQTIVLTLHCIIYGVISLDKIPAYPEQMLGRSTVR